ncbi:MAG: site-specific DNA-methyltransferase [Nitrospirota bacterium]
MDSIEKFQSLLREIFQFEVSDLDFGIYRILNYKRERIEQFINEDLKNKVEIAFAKHKDERLLNINQTFEETKQKVIQMLGQNAFTPTGELKEEFKDTPVGRDYLLIKAQKDEIVLIDEIRLRVFNDLYNFFSRFYEEGDFVPQYRYSIKGHKYAIPSNGEEVKLYWANNEQYYTKTGLLFRDYTFYADVSKSFKITFRTVSAKEELGSNKATKERFFILDDEMPVAFVCHSHESGNPVDSSLWIPASAGMTEKKKGMTTKGVFSDENTLIIRFQYRELTDKEVKHYGVEGGSNTSKQEKINSKNYEEILKRIKDATLKTLLGKEYKPVPSKSEGTEKPTLLYQLSRFTAKNTKDYFIHKNLRRFLSEQMDYFIKAEVLSIETLEKERFLDKHITRAKVVKEIGADIIDFLAQIEDFQKRLWEKKKFVLKTEYVITTDRVPEEFHNEILKNKKQLKEWKELGFIEHVIPAPYQVRGKTPAGIQNKKLPIDTKYFSQEFKEKLLEMLTDNADLDELLDGLLIKSENYQALNLLLRKYKEKVQTIYIDPPFNKEQDADYLYNVKYKDSTWISILENRLRLARNLMSDRGSIFVRCDYNGNWLVRPLMNEIFEEGNFRNEIIVNKSIRMKTEGRTFPSWHDSILLYSKNNDVVYFHHITEDREKEEWRSIDMEGEKWDIIPHNMLKLFSPKNVKYDEDGNAVSRARILLSKEILPRKGRRYPPQEIINELEKQGKIRFSKTGNPQMLKPQDIFLTDDWTGFYGYSFNWNFPTENSEILLKRVIESTSNEGDLVMDFFLGSGTTTAVAHKLGRKWLGIEMGEHFYTVVLPRMKKVLAYDKSGISKEVKKDYKGGGFFKYQILEQYEDTLDNIELTPNEQAELKFGEDYLLKYFLDYETRGNTCLLNIEKLNPFSYKLRVNPEEIGEPQEMLVDIPETFNYLLGVKVKKIKARHNQRKYLFILGEKEGKDIAIVWREYDDNWSDEDFKKDKEFIIQELDPVLNTGCTPHIVYVNGQSILTPKFGTYTVEIRYTEPELKNLMEG